VVAISVVVLLSRMERARRKKNGKWDWQLA